MSFDPIANAFTVLQRAIVEGADSATLFAISPLTKRNRPEDRLGSYPVLRRHELNAQESAIAVEVIDEAIRRNRMSARCFFAHHGVRFVKGQAWVDLVICFACRLGYLHDWKGGRSSFGIDDSALPFFQRFLADAS